ncbi:MAG: helix-hairpin-helix domain-containing protein [Paludibacteraceae bacterium]|nr:helix-hairpin-helix domain-containing protein [Paludibacteraceae bacterium]
MKGRWVFMALALALALALAAQENTGRRYMLDDVILDIYRAATELGETDYEQLQTDLYALYETPIDLNATTDEELQQLPFLSPHQIDELLAYADRHPFESVYELQLIPSLTSYDIRNLLPFITITNNQSPITNHLYAREVFRNAKHEVLTRIDARNIEGFEGTDPMYVQGRYRFDYQRRVVLGAQLRRPAGGGAQDLQYGAYLQLKDIGPLHTLVAGNFQASFGQGLVLASPFHSGKSAYVSTVGLPQEGLRYYSSVDGEGLHGAGTTFRWKWNGQTRLDVSALYSMRRANDSTWHHLVGANVTVRHKRLHVQLTAVENIWSDSIRPYRNTNYNRHYFRGRTQAVIGVSARYNHGWFDLFGEVATAQNRDHWGVGTLIGSRFYPTEGVSLLALYRYYSPYFDNALGYAFSETSRLGDENGGYLGFELTRWKNWRVWGYADVFGFSGPKYGIPDAPSIGFDALVEVCYRWLSLRLRAKQKGELNTYMTRAQFDWIEGPWSLRTTAEANLTHQTELHYGVTLYQDVAYRFQQAPVSLRGRVQFFDAREWNNRIYAYEHDVLYAFSIPAVYGLGGRAYLCLRWQIIPQLALYCRVSETLWQKAWYSAHHPSWSGKGIPSRTDIHLLLRATL